MKTFFAIIAAAVLFAGCVSTGGDGARTGAFGVTGTRVSDSFGDECFVWESFLPPTNRVMRTN